MIHKMVVTISRVANLLILKVLTLMMAFGGESDQHACVMFHVKRCCDVLNSLSTWTCHSAPCRRTYNIYPCQRCTQFFISFASGLSFLPFLHHTSQFPRGANFGRKRQRRLSENQRFGMRRA